MAKEAIRLPEERREEDDPKVLEVHQQENSGDVEDSDSEVDCMIHSRKLKEDLLSALNKIQPSAWIPDNQPLITLPVNEAAATRLIAASHRASFGKESEIAVDELIQTEDPARDLSALGVVQDFSELQRSLKNWSASKSGAIVHILEHKYTDYGLKLSAIKGADHSRVMALQRCAGMYKHNIFLGSMEHERSGPAEDDHGPCDRHRGMHSRREGWYDDDDDDDDDDGEDCDSSDDNYHAIHKVLHESTILRSVVLLDEAGTEILTDVDLNDDELLWDEAFTGVREPDEHIYEGHNRHKGARATHWYLDTVVVLVPTKRTLQWCTKSFPKFCRHQNVLPLLTWWRNECDQQSSTEETEQANSDLCEACIYVIQQNSCEIRPFTVDERNEAIKILLHLGNYDGLVAAVASSVNPKSSAALRTLAPLISDHFERLAPALTKEFDRFDCVTFMFEALKSLFNGQLDEHVDTTTNWIKRTIKRAIGGIVEPKEQDGTTLAEITIFFRCSHDMSEVIKRRTGNTNFMLAFLANLIRKSHEVLPPEEVLGIVKLFLCDVLHDFLPDLLSTAGNNKTNGYDYTVNADPKASRCTAPDIAELWRYLFQTGMRAEIESFSAAIVRAAMVSCATSLADIYMPFLRLIQPLVRDNLDNDYAPLWRRLYCNVFKACIEKCVQKQPPFVQNWAQDRIKCSCSACRRVSLYLTNNTRQVGVFSLRRSKLKHVKQQLASSCGIDCTYTTERNKRPPPTLVITKSDRPMVADDAWYARCDAVAKLMGTFDQDLLRDVLDKNYAELMEMRAVTHSREATLPTGVKRAPSKILKPRSNPPQEARAPAAVAGPSQAGKKRKIETVDLLDSD